ncbi:hypothetical protein [Reyranella massiliensis]|uniref:hypothetical protein n=1 Tax=Reyranella massiliensis TaxID=445220 RepID=UPI0002F20778|nr:hypothetical protein [Reyranella massiliensis]
MQGSPIVTIQTVSGSSGFPFPTAGAALETLTELGITHETTGQIAGYTLIQYLALLDRGADPILAELNCFNPYGRLDQQVRF